MNKTNNDELLVIDDYSSPVLVKQFLSRKYETKTDENGNTMTTELPVGILPDIELYVNIGGTNYYVNGSYSGTSSIEDKISQILKRDMEG